MIYGNNNRFSLLFIMLASGDPTLGLENHCVWNCARI